MIPPLHCEVELRHMSTDEYPVTANATIGIPVPPCASPAALHKVATPSVKIMGSPTNHKTPRLSRPKRVISSRRNKACSTRHCSFRQSKNDSSALTVMGDMLIRMLAHACDQNARHAPDHETHDEQGHGRAESVRFHGFVRQAGLHQALEIQLLLRCIDSGGFQFGKCDTQLFVGERNIE